MTTRRSGLLPQNIFAEVIFEKFKGPCGHDTGRSGHLPQIILPEVIFSENSHIILWCSSGVPENMPKR